MSVLQGSVATLLRYDVINKRHVIRNFILSWPM